jgi:hypothetical protein
MTVVSVLKGWSQHKGSRQILVLLFFVLLTLLMTWPLPMILATGVLGPPGDNLEYCYKLAWFRKAIFEWQVSPFFNPSVFYPVGYPLALHEMSLANVCLGMPVLLTAGSTAAYNLLVLLSFALSGFTAYLLAWKLTHRRGAGLLAGILYAFSTYRMGHLGAGHLNLLGTQWLPLFLLSLEQLLSSKRVRSAILAGVFFALSALSSWYYAPMFGLCAALYVLARARPWRQRLLDRRLTLLLVVAVAIASVLMAPSALLTAQQWSRGEMQFSLPEADRYSASMDDWVIPNPLHSWWGDVVADHFVKRQDVPEFLVSLSWVGVVLAALTLRRKRPAIAGAYALLLVASLVLGLGTTLHIDGQRVYVAVPSWAEKGFTVLMGWIANRLALHPSPSYYELRVPGAIYFPLPSLLAYLYVPFFSAMRVWTRFAAVVTLALAVLAGLGWSRLQGWIRPASVAREQMIGALILALAVLELWTPPFAMGWSEVQPQPVDTWLAERTDVGAVAVFPLSKAECGPGLYAAMVHGRPVVYGYGGFFPQWYLQVRPILWTFPSNESIFLLREWGVRFVLVAEDSYGEQWPEVERVISFSSYLRPMAVFEGKSTYHEGWFARQVPDLSRAFIVDRVHVYELREYR